jgi:hypothetical protein
MPLSFGQLVMPLRQPPFEPCQSEVKVKMWDDQMKALTPQRRADLINQLRWQVNKAGERRVEDQMSPSYGQTEGKK